MRLVPALLVLTLSSVALAEQPAAPHKFELAADAGWNGPGGLGIAAELRPVAHLGLTLDMGLSVAGPLATLGARFYFSRTDSSWFVGAGYSHTTGNEVDEHINHHLEGFITPRRYFTIAPADLIPVTVGYHATFFRDRLVVTPYAGYSFRKSGGQLTPLDGYQISEAQQRFYPPGGVVAGISVGMAFD